MTETESSHGTWAAAIARTSLDRWATAFARMDPAALIELYADDAIFSGSSPQLYRGRDGVRAYFENLFPLSNAKVAFEDIVAVSPFPSVIALAVAATFTLGPGEPRRVRLTQTLILGRGQWEILTHHASRQSH
jgi:uncharacterized protein (TIGR02246 family)